MNLHGFNNREDDNNENSQGQGNRRGLLGGNGGGQPNPMAGLMGGDPNADPRKETFMQMIKINFCPAVALHSFVVYFSAVMLIVFTLQLAIGKYPLYTNVLRWNQFGRRTIRNPNQ